VNRLLTDPEQTKSARKEVTEWNKELRQAQRDKDKKTIEKLNLRPEEIVFIDNQIGNLKSAANLGIKTLHYQSYGKFLKELKKLL
jgi:uncharacterized membrane protein (DUF106 family)